ASLILIPWKGTQKAQQFLIVISAMSAFLMFMSLLSGPKPEASSGVRPKRRLFWEVSLLISSALAAWLALATPEVPRLLVAYGRYMGRWIGQGDIIYMGEGMNSSVAVSQLSGGVRNFHVSGKVEASSEPQDMRLQRMLGHLPALLHPNPRSVLIV